MHRHLEDDYDATLFSPLELILQPIDQLGI